MDDDKMHHFDPAYFDETGYPELTDIFRNIDLGIAAIIAAEPSLKRKAPQRRKRASPVTKSAARRSLNRSRRKAA